MPKAKSTVDPDWKPDPSILIGPNIPTPMHETAPRIVLGSVWWRRTKEKCYASTGYRCLACGVHKTKAKYFRWLEAHETYEINYRMGWMTYLRTVPLCHYCHNYVHDGRLRYLLETNQINHGKYANILIHGDAVLAKAGLKRKSFSEREEEKRLMTVNGEVAKWEDWRLIVDGMTYPPKYATQADYMKAMGVEGRWHEQE